MAHLTFLTIAGNATRKCKPLHFLPAAPGEAICHGPRPESKISIKVPEISHQRGSRLPPGAVANTRAVPCNAATLPQLSFSNGAASETLPKSIATKRKLTLNGVSVAPRVPITVLRTRSRSTSKGLKGARLEKCFINDLGD